MANRVRQHTRRTASGGTTKVRQHGRTGRARKAVVSPGHAWALVKRAHRASKRKKRALAITLAVIAVLEVGAFLALNGIALIAAVAGGLAILVAVTLGSLGGISP